MAKAEKRIVFVAEKGVEIVIDTNSLKLSLRDYTKQIQSKWDFLYFFGLFLSLAIPLATCDFHDVFNMKAPVIEAIVWILCIGFLIAAICSAAKRFRNPVITPDELVDQIQEKAEKNAATITTTPLS